MVVFQSVCLEANLFYGSILNWLDRALMDLAGIAETNYKLCEPGYVEIKLVG